MFELLLMRHAKSDWSQQLSDSDRPLNNRGREDALNMGKYLKKLNLLPDQIVLSSSVRTRETADILLQSFSIDKNSIFIDDSLYLASLATLCVMAERYFDNTKRLLLLAHNPGIDEIVSYLTTENITFTASGKLMTTCSVAVFQIETKSAFKKSGMGHLKEILRPKEI